MLISGWGRYPKIKADIYSSEKHEKIADYLRNNHCIARGLGRSYGDSALYSKIFSSKRLNCLLAFNAETGILHCESGITLYDIVHSFVPRGWFLGVTPGTQWVTIGGAIASDVHGKNHHRVGCFSEFVHSLQLVLPNGEIINCNREQNSELFHATCGGMGLTGIILSAQIQLIPIQSAYIEQTTYKTNSLEETIELFEKYSNVSYSVAWLDCTQTENRGVLILGEHAQNQPYDFLKTKTYSIPFAIPAMLNRYTATWFNKFYYQMHRNEAKQTIYLIDYFYPLDRISNWNLLYGKNGFLQYQCVIPESNAKNALQKIMHKINSSSHKPFLAVLKLLGTENANYLSFPLKGYTLALDFKYSQELLPFLNELDHIVQEHGGRIYLTKDACMSQSFFEASYAKLETFKALREKIAATAHINSLQSQRLGLDR